MPLITRLMLQNFKKFPELDLRFTHDRNILVGDNESGKSTLLLALDLVPVSYTHLDVYKRQGQLLGRPGLWETGQLLGRSGVWETCLLYTSH